MSFMNLQELSVTFSRQPFSHTEWDSDAKTDLGMIAVYL